MTNLKDYTLDGTANGTVTTGNSGFTLLGGTAPLYDPTGTGMRVADGQATTASYGEDQTTGDYCAFVFSVPAMPTGFDDTIFQGLNAATSLCGIRLKLTSNVMAIYSGLGTLAATGTYVLSTNTKYRIEHYMNPAGTQELRLYAETGSTLLDNLTGSMASALAGNKRRIGHPQTAQAAGVTDFFSFSIHDVWPNLGASSDPWVYNKFARFGP